MGTGAVAAIDLNHALLFLAESVADQKDIEFNAHSQTSGQSYVITVKRLQLFGAVFTSLADSDLRDLVDCGQPIRIEGNVYRIGFSFREAFLSVVRSARSASTQSLNVMSVTIQYPSGIVCHVSHDLKELQALAMSILPTDLTMDVDSVHGLSRDEGRKIGYAAKDKSQLRNQLITLNSLKNLEETGSAIAENAVTKDRVLPRKSVEQLRQEGIEPAIAYLLIHVRRILPAKPAPYCESRRQYVTLLPALLDALSACRTLSETQEFFDSSDLVSDVALSGIGASRLKRFARWVRRGWFGIGRLKGYALSQLESLPAESAWQIVDQALSVRRSQVFLNGLPMPLRVAFPLSTLRRAGPDRPIANVGRLINVHGYTGVEQGKWVSSRESQPLVQWVADSCADLEMLLGTWLPSLNRRGNIGLGLGARGCGRSSAHYEGSLRVVNLTKTRGDGSLAHEYGHFLDHMISEFGEGPGTRYLSEKIAKGGSANNRISEAMRSLLGAIGLIPAETELTGNRLCKRWYSRRWVLSAWTKAGGDPQAAFSALASQYPKKFESGHGSECQSQLLVNSLARWTNSDVVIKARFIRKSSFLKEATTLGIYWKRPCELFARVFECWCEDTLHALGMQNQYLVDQTRIDYTRCKGLPYPVGAERDILYSAASRLIEACRDEFEQSSAPLRGE